ncbi:hydrogenase maturation protease [Gimesia aquarii]|uniref:Hydrogenase maturation protease n=1 Tax=Gimesia aquarii TaxID=2527964 RepID=A0A517VVZ7_9PLAN|nr:hydrogenase maturation protease [Gimesia aquarii]QDT97178.1 Hydrogenase maturation protease [Gimesia aquarii]
MKHQSQILVIGIGSPHGDDQVGWEIAKQIQDRDSKFVDVRLARTPDDLLDWLEGIKQLVICDACQGAGDVGTHHHWKWPSDQLETMTWSGTHHVSLPSVLALAEQLGRLPTLVQIWGVEIEQTQPGDSMSESVKAGTTVVAKTICQDLSIPTKKSETQHA